MKSMYRNILVFIVAGLFIIACKDDCKENPPKPLSFLLHWENSNGEDAYSVNLLEKDSLVAFYKFNHKLQKVDLKVNSLRDDSTFHFVDMMPMIRKVYEIEVDTLFIRSRERDIDTIYMNLVKIESECYSTLYEFKELKYNGKEIEEDNGFYRIKK